LSIGKDFAVLLRDQGSEFAVMLFKKRFEFKKDASTLDSRYLAPCRKRRTSGLHGCIYVGRGCRPDGCDDFTCRRIKDVQLAKPASNEAFSVYKMVDFGGRYFGPARHGSRASIMS